MVLIFLPGFGRLVCGWILLSIQEFPFGTGPEYPHVPSWEPFVSKQIELGLEF